jgi:AcrR family transcriptional regulator
VVDVAVRDASIKGLEGLTIGRLANEVELSKSGLFGLFGDKEALQLATLRAGIEQFVEEVWKPVRAVAPGLPRLLALCERWIGFHERGVVPGGCFMTTALVEFDARPGAVHDAVAASTRRWFDLLEGEVRTAVEAGEMPPNIDPAEVAFHLNALASAASCHYHLSGSATVLDRARQAMRGVLGARAMTASG